MDLTLTLGVAAVLLLWGVKGEGSPPPATGSVPIVAAVLGWCGAIGQGRLPETLDPMGNPGGLC